MHLLVAINDNIPEWRETLTPTRSRPRLPLPYAFGAAFIKKGHKVSAINLSGTSTVEQPPYPFESVYHAHDLARAMKQVDVASLWGGYGISAVLRQYLLLPIRRRVILNSYVWQVESTSTLRSKKLGLSTRVAAHFAKALVVMTDEQAEMARRMLGKNVPVIKYTCGIDTAYYRSASDISDVPEVSRGVVMKLLSQPYVVMPGDELRLDQDALEMVTKSDLRLVRISQYSQGKQELLRREAKERGINDRLITFENISYPFLRFLLQHAVAYAGMVDSTWQPAGWSVACEAMASGLPIVLYEGLVSRELKKLSLGNDFVHSIPMKDIRAFQYALQDLVHDGYQSTRAVSIQRFAGEKLDCEHTSVDFVNDIEQVIG
jgi:glycosyltransferase involved in cell wall biosynthesis